jgi:hypothetical protein
MTVLAKCVAVLAELVDQQAEASAPKKRGRPRKEKTEKDKEE